MELFEVLAAGMFLVPLLTSAFFLVLRAPKETWIHPISTASAWATFALTLVTVVGSLFLHLPVEVEYSSIFRSEHYRFPLVLYFDVTTAVFLFTTAVLALLVVSYSRVYLHRETGYRRFFACIFLFWSGLNLLFSAGTLDLLFAGWEIVGISSFLLIAFYWNRRNPAVNAFRAYCVYRFCDVGLLVGAWLNHVLWHGAERFSELAKPETLTALAQLSPLAVTALGSLVILAASGKSSQFPFMFWLPKAMEGPTPSSAIFYGALSVHAGVFLLIRTFPIWHSSPLCIGLVATIGALSALIGTANGRSQSNIKAQIAYASATQVGIQFIELALGLPTLALVHFVANAGFRCYQLLVSPSVVAYLLRLQGSVSAQFKLSPASGINRLPKSLRASIYVFSLSEGYIESMILFFILTPLNWVRRLFSNGPVWQQAGWLGGLLGLGLLFASLKGPVEYSADTLSFVICIGCLLASLRAITEPNSLRSVWSFAGASSLLAAFAVVLQQPHSQSDVSVFVGGLVGFWLLGIGAIAKLETVAKGAKPFCRGAGNLAPISSGVLIVAFLGVSGFPFSPTFIGEDLLLQHATNAHHWMAAVLSVLFVLNGIAIVRSLVPLHYSPYVRQL
jgi:NADH-quinone oxidoreductase subunit L